MNNGGYINLHRKILEWEWYSNINIKLVFLHCLLLANWDDKKWRGMTIKRGQFFTSVESFSVNLGISVRSIRSSFAVLKKTNELIIETTNKGTVITVCKYDFYQMPGTKNDKRTDKQVDKRTDKPNVTPTTTTNNSNNIIIENNNIPFDDFWNLYDKKIERKSCENKWNRLTNEKKEKIMETLPKFLSRINDKKYLPYPETYLNGERWNDVLDEVKQFPNSASAHVSQIPQDQWEF